MGIGLAVCRRLMELNSGLIWLRNNPSGGAIFSFSLPLSVDWEASVTQDAPLEQMDLTRSSV